MYEYTFKAYTGGYFPITQTSDSISFTIRGTGTFVFDWGDGTTTSYTLSTGGDTTISKTWTTNLGGQKNITVTSSLTVKNWTRINYDSRALDNSIIRVTYMSLSTLRINNCPLVSISGSITGMPLTFLINNCPLVSISGSITGMLLSTFGLYNCPLVSISGSITGMPLTFLQLYSCPLISISGSITGLALTYLSLTSCPLSNIIGNIETCSVSSSTINVQQPGITYGGGALKAWVISITIQAAWTSTMLDAFLNAFALVAPTVTGKTLNVAGTNAAPTSASASARSVITSRGYLIISNS